MRFFGLGANDEDAAAKQRREDSQRSLEQGGLPLNATDRLREQAGRQGTAGHIFTSDLSVNELALTLQAGCEPLGQVMGSSVYHVGWQYMPAGYWSTWGSASQELTVLTAAFYHARHLALGRLQQEAALLGAGGVVGVRLEHKAYEWGMGMLEFSSIGTAIRESGGAPGGALPFVSDLSGQEFWILRQSGFRPIGLVVGNCSYYCVPGWQTRNAVTGGFFAGSWQNQELMDYTQSLYSARSLAMGRMEQEARDLGASGVVGADVHVEAEPREIEVNNQTRIDMLYHFTAIGTAIAPAAGRSPTFKVENAVSLG